MPVSSEQWTIDRIAHALPHSATRQTFLAEVNTVPLDQLPDVLERWVRVAEQWAETSVRVEALRDDPHAMHALLAEGVDVTDDIAAEAVHERGAA